MSYDPLRHHRRSIRLQGYDYGQEGAYFVTICTQNRERVVGEIKDGAMMLDGAGDIVKRCWDEIPDHFENVELGDYVIMPNHIHGVIILREVHRRDEVTSSLRDVPRTEIQQPMNKRSPTLGQVIAFYKYRSTKLINEVRDAPDKRFWQRNYYEHIIRNEKDHTRIREYIEENVSRWMGDNENPLIAIRPNG
jgi:putative transposase